MWYRLVKPCPNVAQIYKHLNRKDGCGASGNPGHRRYLVPGLDIHDAHALRGAALHPDLAGENSDHLSVLGGNQQLVIL